MTFLSCNKMKKQKEKLENRKKQQIVMYFCIFVENKIKLEKCNAIIRKNHQICLLKRKFVKLISISNKISYFHFFNFIHKKYMKIYLKFKPKK